MSKTTAVDAALLDDIRTSFVKDGLQWAMHPDKKLIHVWKKLSRAEEELRKTSIEANQQKKKHKEELTDAQGFLEQIKTLSKEKETITKLLEEENEALQIKMAQLSADNEAFRKDNAAVAELCSERGILDKSGRIPDHPVQLLKFIERTKKDSEKSIEIQKTLESLRKEMEKVKMEKLSLEKRLAECEAELENEKAKLATIKEDHGKQRKMHQKQIHDLRDKVLQFEANKQGQESSRMDQLQEALSQVATLTSELNRSTEIAQDTDKRNTALFEELSRANIVNERISGELEKLHHEMSVERDKSVTVLEEELQRQHDLQCILETTQQQLHDSEIKVATLTEDLKHETEAYEELQVRVQELEQASHEKQAIGYEKDLLQQTMAERERSIETLEHEVQSLHELKQSILSKNVSLEAKIKELVSTTEELNQQLLEAVRVNKTNDREKAQMQQTLINQATENDSTKEILGESKADANRMRTELKSLKQQLKDQKASMDSQLLLLQTEKEDLLHQLDEESLRQDKVRESLNSSVSQLQDELHSKCEELSRVQHEVHQVKTESTSLKQNLETEVVSKNETAHQLETLLSENEMLQDKLSHVEQEMKRKESQAITSQHQFESEAESKLNRRSREIEALQSKLKAVTAEGNLTQASLAAKLKDAQDSQHEQVGRTKAAEDRVSALESEVQAKEVELSGLQQQIKTFVAEKSSLEATVTTLQKDLQLSKELLSSSTSAMNDENTALQKQLETHKKELKFIQVEFDAERANLQAQIATLKSKMMSVEQQVQATTSSLEAEQTLCKSLHDEVHSGSQRLMAAEQELETVKGELVVMTKKAEENHNHVKILASSCNESKLAVAAKEKECEQALSEKASIAETLGEMESAFQDSQERVQKLENQLSKANEVSEEANVKLQEKQQEFVETVKRLKETDSLYAKARESLEREQACCTGLEQKERTALLTLDKSQKQGNELAQKNNVLQARVKKLEADNIKLSTTSRRIESKLAKKIIDLSKLQDEKENVDKKLAGMELELTGLQQKVPRLEKSALCEDEVASLREQLQQEKIQRVIGEQAVLSLQDKVASLEETKAEKDILLKEKHHTVLTTESYAKEQKIQCQRSREKMEVVICEKESLEDVVKSLHEIIESYKDTVEQLEDKCEKAKLKYSNKKRHTSDRLASSLTHFSREKRSLESTIDDVKDELRTAKNQLDYENKWKETAEQMHRKILEEKTVLTTSLVSAEEKLREHSQQIVALEMKLSRSQQENTMLEERNKILVDQLQNSAPSPPEVVSPIMQMNTSLSSTNGLQTLLALSARNYSSPTHHQFNSSFPSHHHRYTLPTSPPTIHRRSSTPLTPPTGSSQTN